MKPWQNEQFVQNILRDKQRNMHSNQKARKTHAHEEDQYDEQEDFMDNEDEGLYSNDEGELDQSFDDSDLQNKDPGKHTPTYARL